jgi:hypothetical protein
MPSSLTVIFLRISTTGGQSSIHFSLSSSVGKANAIIFLAIKKILEDKPKGKWAEELPRAVWSHNTSVCWVTNITPFRLLYGRELVTPKEIKLCSARTKTEAIYNPTETESKDLLEPEHRKAIENLQSYQSEMRAWRDKKAKQKQIEPGDVVLLRSPRTEAYGKLEPKWIGPYLVTEKTRPGSFCLANTEGRVLE